MSFRSPILAGAVLLAGVLGLGATPSVARADTLHGPPRPARSAPVIVRGGHGHAHGQGHAHGRGHDVRTVRRVRGHGHVGQAHRTPVHRVTVHRAHVHRHGHCRFVEGHYVTRRKRVVVPGHHVERVIPARYEVRWRGHCYVRVLVEARRVVRDWVPERVEIRRKRVWVRGRWVCA